MPKLDDNTRADIVNAGKEVLAARAKHPNQSLADLYDPDFMPRDLRNAHQQLDKVVDAAFGATNVCASSNERLQLLFNNYAGMAR